MSVSQTNNLLQHLKHALCNIYCLLNTIIANIWAYYTFNLSSILHPTACGLVSVRRTKIECCASFSFTSPKVSNNSFEMDSSNHLYISLCCQIHRLQRYFHHHLYYGGQSYMATHGCKQKHEYQNDEWSWDRTHIVARKERPVSWDKWRILLLTQELPLYQELCLVTESLTETKLYFAYYAAQWSAQWSAKRATTNLFDHLWKNHMNEYGASLQMRNKRTITWSK